MTGDSPAPLLHVEDLRIQSATSGSVLVSGVSFQMAAGERLAIIGTSGAGKSVLSHAIAGVLGPRLRVVSGDIRFAHSTRTPGRAAFLMFQNPGTALNPCLRIRTQLRRIAGRAGCQPVSESVKAALEQSGLSPGAAERYPFQISGGMKQRVIFAAALLQRPALLIADEVTTGLDPVSRREFRASLDALLERSGAALLFVSHDLGLAAEICPKALVLDRGRAIAQGSWSALGEQHPAAAALVSAALTLDEPLC